MKYFFCEYCDLNGESKMWKMKMLPSDTTRTTIQIMMNCGKEGCFDEDLMKKSVVCGNSADFVLRELDVLVQEVGMQESCQGVFKEKLMRNTIRMSWITEENETHYIEDTIYPNNQINFDMIENMLNLLGG